MPDSGASSMPAPPFAQGGRIAGTPYRVLRRLPGQPARAEVEHVERPERFVVEALPDAALRFDMPRRLANEWQRLGALAHLNLASVSDAGVTPDGFGFCVLRGLGATTLAEHCARESRLCAVEALGIAASLLSALGAAHGIGVVHGGVRPDNVFVGPRAQVQLAGFGVAKLAHTPAALRYAAPEQRAGKPFGRRADLYAAGLVLFEMLTGEHPLDHAGASIASLIAKRAAGLPPELEALLGEMLADDPRARPASAARVADRLRKLATALDRGSVAHDAPTRHAGYDASTAPGTFAVPRTDVDVLAAWQEAEASRTRPDGLAARRGSVADRLPQNAETTTLVAAPSAGVTREPAPMVSASPECAPRDAGALTSTARSVLKRARARARVALAACATLACCTLLVWPWAGKLRRWAAPDAPRVSAARRQTPPQRPVRAPQRRRSEMLHAVLVVDGGRGPRPPETRARRAAHPVKRAVRGRSARATSAAAPAPHWAPDIPPNPYLPSSGL
jgi:Protein kinase domain